jgi:hypothetical protein
VGNPTGHNITQVKNSFDYKHFWRFIHFNMYTN